MDSCLGTPVILRQILEQFSNKELMQLSHVNKQRNYEARCVLRDRGNLTARVRSGDHPSKDLAAFASDLKKMRVVPFSGICVQLQHDPTSCRRASRTSYKAIQDRLRIKQVSLDYVTGFDECRDCPAFRLVKQILENSREALESLSFNFYGDQIDIDDWFSKWSFPRLETLKFNVEHTDDDLTSFVKALASSAPNLKELQMVGKTDFGENVLEGSSAVLVPHHHFNPLYDKICQSLIPALRTETIEIYFRQSPHNFNGQMLNRDIPRMLQASLATLKTLRMDLLFAVPLMCYGMCLDNVTTLEIRLAGHGLDTLEPRISTLLKRFDFTRIFPKVLQVEIVNDNNGFSVNNIDGFVEQGHALLMGTVVRDRAINIKHLILRDFIMYSTIPVLAQMFPDVKALTVKKIRDSCPTPFTAIWNHLRHLQELNLISYRRSCWKGNKDSVFCGIFPEEVAELRKKDNKYLKAVHIVPVMPSITCMKDLKTFTFQYTPGPNYPSVSTCNFWFSRVTGFIGFARCPALAVTIQTRCWRCAEALCHMEPFATFTSVDE